MLTALKNTEISFALGEEFDDETYDGRKARSTVTKDGNKLIHAQKIGADAATTTSEFSDTELKQTYTTKGVTSARVFKRL